MNSSFELFITVDRAAADQGLQTQITVSDPMALFGDPGPFLQAGATEARALYNAGQSEGVVTVTVTLPDFPGVMAETNINIVSELPPPPLVINEIEVDQGDIDFAEYVEILAVGDAPVDLSEFSLELVGSEEGSVEPYATYALSLAGGFLQPGEFLVVGTSAALGGLPQGTASIEFPDDTLRDAGVFAYGVRIASGRQRIDSVSYGGFLNEITEGAPPFESDGGDGVLLRCPNGTDTDDNSVDFILSLMGSPGLANTCPQ